MAKKQNNNKNLILGVCAIIAIFVVVVTAILLSAKVITLNPTINDAYFISDDTKYVLNLSNSDSDTEYAPSKTHIVYLHSNDEITSMKAYYEYPNETTAKTAYETIKDSDEFKNTDLSIDGKYIIATYAKENYSGISFSEIRSQLEFMEITQNASSNNTDTEESE